MQSDWSRVETRDASLREYGVDDSNEVLMIAWSKSVRVRDGQDEGVLVEELQGIAEGVDGGRIDGRTVCGER